MSPTLGIWPQPRDITTGSTTLLIDSAFTIKYAIDQTKVPQDLINASKRLENTVKGDLEPNEKKHFYLSPDRGAEFLSSAATTLPSLTIHIEDSASIFDQAIKALEERDETYSLNVPADGNGAVLKARTALGAFRGLTSFEMLFYAVPTPYKSKYHTASAQDTQTTFQAPNNDFSYTPSAPISIKDDHPRFKWRGFMLDTARNWMGKETILKMLDSMAMVKLNQFHWHMTDAQSWPLSLEGYREMAEKGAYSPEQVYDEGTIDEVIKYAGERGIDVMIEIDIPGHTTVLHNSHPSMIAAYNFQPWEEYAACPPGGQIRFMVDDVAEKVCGVLEGLRGRVKGEYMGTGGDEVNEKTYEVDEVSVKTLKDKNQTLMEAFDGFMAKVSKAVEPKTLVVWQEMVQKHAVASLPSNALILVWKQSKDVQEIISQNRRIILCPSNYFYLDLGEGPWVVPEDAGAEHPQNGHYNPWSKIYSFDPYKDIPEEKRHLVLGGQTNMWCERTDEGVVEGKVWPRAAAAAEVFWTGAEPGEYPLNARAALARFQDMRYRLVSKGIRATPLQPHWCAIRPGSC